MLHVHFHSLHIRKRTRRHRLNSWIFSKCADNFGTRGTKVFNQGLSERRASAVSNYLSSNKISADRLNAIGFGENNPIDTNVSASGRSNNRRVEILFVK